MRKGLILFGIGVLALTSCGSLNYEKELTLLRKSSVYVEKDNEILSFPLSTFNRKGEGNVPYVSLREFLPVVKFIDQGFKTEVPLLELSNDKGVYTVSYSNGKEGEPITHPFVFDGNKQTITIKKEAKAFYHLFCDNDPNILTMEHLYKPVEERNRDIPIADDRVIDLKKYDLRIIEQDNELYAPIDLYQVVFKMSMAPSGNDHIAYNGIDYFGSGGSGVVASCYSSSLNFNLQEPNVLTSILKISPAISRNVEFPFSPVEPASNEKYRFECPVIEGGERTVISTKEKIVIPDFFLRITLDHDGHGRYVYINNETKEEFTMEEASLLDNKTVTYTEDEDYINLSVSYPNVFFPGAMQELNSSINKNKTFYLEDERSKEYALYDYKILSLYLGEYYGLVQSNPKVRDSVDFIEDYKEEILSPNYHDYHLAVSKMALEGIDDGHTKVLGFSKFSKDDFNSEENQAAINDMVGPRRTGILKYAGLALGYRASSNLSQGYQVVDDTAYLSFDAFVATPMSRSRNIPPPRIPMSIRIRLALPIPR